VSVVWRRSPFSGKECRAYEVCIFKDRLAVVGTAFDRSVVAFLERDSGVIVRTRQMEHHVYRCAVVGDNLYVAGGKVFVFNDLDSVAVRDSAFSLIASDGNHLYGAWSYWESPRIEVVKMMPNFVRVGYGQVNLMGEVNLYDLGVNPVSGDVLIVGSYRPFVPDNWRPLVVILDGDLKLKKVFEFPVGGVDGVYSVCFGVGGFAYVGGSGGVAKFDVAGEVVAEHRGVGIKKLACVGDYVYGFGDSSGGHILYVFDDNLNLVDRVDLGTPHGVFEVGKPAFDGVYIYVAGYDRVGNTEKWVVYAIETTKHPAATQPTAVFA